MFNSFKEQIKAQGVGDDILRLVSHNAPAKKECFIGKELWETTIVNIAAGNNIILSGNKATGKNVLAQDLAYLFGRPEYEMSFHGSVKANELIDDDGILVRCANEGAFGVLDEINMAESESLAILHSVLDFRRTVDLKGGRRLELHDMTRFIGTMNYGYMGTKELNEALVSRFQVINVPPLTQKRVVDILKLKYPTLVDKYANGLAELFIKLQDRAKFAEISTKSVDLRGMIDGLRSLKMGLSLYSSLTTGVVDKAFVEYERQVVYNDMIYIFAKDATREEVFEDGDSVI